MAPSLTNRRAPLLAAVALLATACGDPAAPVAGEIVSVAVDSSAGPLIRVVTVQLDRPAPAEVSYGAANAPVLVLTADSLSVEHRFVLPRLRADREYELEVAIPRGAAPTAAATFGTGALPPEIAEIQLEETGEPSLPVALAEVVGAPRFTGLLIVEDAEVVGYVQMAGSLFGMTRRANGDIVLLDGAQGLVSRRLDGTVAHRLPQPAEDPAAAYGPIHHDVVATPDNTLLFIANDTRVVDGEEVVGEALWEWDPEGGTVVKRWSAHDHLDWATDRGLRSNPGNWLHGNGIQYGPRGNVVMSLRNADLVVSIAPDFSRVEWELGGPNGTLHLADEDRFFGQHYVSEPSRDRLLVYDNGFDRPGGAYTRAIEYAIDVGRGTATRVWEYRHAPQIYAPLVGSARRLPNGNTTMLFGMVGGQGGSSGPLTAVEVTPAGSVRWRLDVGPQLTRLYRLTPVESLVGERAAAR